MHALPTYKNLVILYMEFRKGIATKVRNTVNISGGGKNGIVSTTHITLFYIDNMPIKLASPQPSFINENDEISVSGKIKNGFFIALAHENITTGTSGDNGAIGKMIFGSLFPIVGITIFKVFGDDFFGYFPVAIGSAFILIGLYLLYSGLEIFSAKKNLLDKSNITKN